MWLRGSERLAGWKWLVWFSSSLEEVADVGAPAVPLRRRPTGRVGSHHAWALEANQWERWGAGIPSGERASVSLHVHPSTCPHTPLSRPRAALWQELWTEKKQSETAQDLIKDRPFVTDDMRLVRSLSLPSWWKGSPVNSRAQRALSYISKLNTALQKDHVHLMAPTWHYL